MKPRLPSASRARAAPQLVHLFLVLCLLALEFAPDPSPLQRIIERCPSIEEPMQEGLRYTHVRHQILTKVPRLLELLSEVDNAKHDTFRQEGPVETMLHVHQRAKRMNAQTDEQFAQVIVAVSRGHKESFRVTVDHIAQYVCKYAGSP